MENFPYDDHKIKESHGLKIMTWNHFIVWDQQQENYLKKFCPYANYTQVGYIDFSGNEFFSLSNRKVKRLAVFDITPTRPTFYTMLGFAISPYYSEKLNLTFLHDIIEVFNSDNWEILWKPKRNVDKKFISETFNQKQLNIFRNKINIIAPNIAARSLVESSDAVISIPFTSTAILGKINGIPSVYYDASGTIEKNRSRGIPLIKNRIQLKEWCESIVVNKYD
jgi:polysaccharide biosynthesis PFTS motif protein